MSTYRNNDIRTLAKSQGVRMYEVAEACGMSYSNLCVRLRKDLTSEQAIRLTAIINDLARQRRAELDAQGKVW